METLQEFKELREMKGMIETPEFQKYIVKAFREYQAKLKPAYNCKTLQEIGILNGKKQGSDLLFEILKDIESDFQNRQKEVEDSASEKL